MAAAVGIGAYRDLAAAADAMASVDAVFEPSPPLRTFFEDRAALYRAAKAQALALADRAASVGAGPRPARLAEGRGRLPRASTVPVERSPASRPGGPAEGRPLRARRHRAGVK